MNGRVTCGPSTVRWHVTTCGGVQSPALNAHREGHRRHRSQAEPMGTLAPLAQDPAAAAAAPLASVNSSGSAHSDGFIPTLFPT